MRSIRNYILEYLVKDVYSLYKYLSLSEKEKISSLYEMFPYSFNRYVKKYDLDIDLDYDDYDSIIDFLNRNPRLKKDYNEFLYQGVKDFNLPIHDSEYPAWSFFSDNPQIIKNQWLVHLTEHAYDIFKHGFTRGVDEIDKLGLTTHIGDIDKEYGGFNFAYTPEDFSKYSKNRHGYKYGDKIVMFRASGVRVYHYSDGEYQTIFYGNTAKNIIPISGPNDMWEVTSNIDDKVLYSSENPDKVIDWVINNYTQYRKHLKNPYGGNT